MERENVTARGTFVPMWSSGLLAVSLAYRRIRACTAVDTRQVNCLLHS